MAIPQNQWINGKFVMPAVPAGILAQQAPTPLSSGLLAAGVNPASLGLLGVSNRAFGNDGNPSTDSGSGTANPDAGPSANVGIGPPSGAPGTGGVGGLAAGVMTGLGFLTNPLTAAIGYGVGRASGRKGLAEHVMNAINGSPGVSVADSVSGGVGNTGIGVSPGSAEAQAQALGFGTTGTGENTTGASPGTTATGVAPGSAAAAAQAAGVATNETGQNTTGAGGAGAGGGDAASTVICTMLHDLGYMDDATYAADAEFGRMVGLDVKSGYHRWAIPYVRYCRHHRSSAGGWLALHLAVWLGGAWAREMAYRIGVVDRGSLTGAFLMLVGIPVCRFLGRNRKPAIA